MPFRPLLALLALVAAPLLDAPGKEIVREERRVTVGGVQEVWRLIWRGPPHDAVDCGPQDPDSAATCPCSGIAYAQTGDLVLERQRPGAPPERMRLAPLFAGSEMMPSEDGLATIPRWPYDSNDVARKVTTKAIRARPAVPILNLADYDHDGVVGEFLLQIDTPPCGKQLMVAVGTSRAHPGLHALTSAEHPERPLALYRWQWEALARNPRPAELADWPCGDHGAEEETKLLLRADRGAIHATRVTGTCPDDGQEKGRTRFVKKVLGREIL
ncbi:hypothetical protein [Sphingomonas trueperi]|uniref:hypothetical protein n=1 Tax=Sphingomonas trueperi TaxID=53317 RepID=UPI000EAF77A8